MCKGKWLDSIWWQSLLACCIRKILLMTFIICLFPFILIPVIQGKVCLPSKSRSKRLCRGEWTTTLFYFLTICILSNRIGEILLNQHSKTYYLCWVKSQCSNMLWSLLYGKTFGLFGIFFLFDFLVNTVKYLLFCIYWW